MITLRRAADRGASRTRWLDSRHTFSFADYFDPAEMGFRSLRVINDDRVAPAAGFPPHGHADMEIITYVLDGALEHRDSLGTGSVIRPGDVQRMSAGTGVRHSEMNASRAEPVHFLQIWLLPVKRGLAPGYEQKQFPTAEKTGRLRLCASPDGRDGSLTIHQDVELHAGLLGAGQTTTLALAPERAGWVQVARGSVKLNGLALAEGDGAAVEGERSLELTGDGPGQAEVLVFDLG